MKQYKNTVQTVQNTVNTGTHITKTATYNKINTYTHNTLQNQPENTQDCWQQEQTYWPSC